MNVTAVIWNSMLKDVWNESNKKIHIAKLCSKYRLSEQDAALDWHGAGYSYNFQEATYFPAQHTKVSAENNSSVVSDRAALNTVNSCVSGATTPGWWCFFLSWTAASLFLIASVKLSRCVSCLCVSVRLVRTHMLMWRIRCEQRWRRHMIMMCNAPPASLLATPVTCNVIDFTT